MIIKNSNQRHQYFEACRISVEILKQLYDQVAIGVVPIEIDQLAGKLCEKYGVKPAFYAVQGKKGIYGYNTCIQVNDVAVHGIPDSVNPIKSGDLVSIDFGIIYEGLYTDHCVTVGVGEVSEADKKLLRVGRESVLNATKQAVTGNHTGDLGYVMESQARQAGFDTLKEYIGHGIGTGLHDEPEIPAYGQPHTGDPLHRGEVICVESQVVAGQPKVKTDSDGWTTRTRDGENAVMFEFMVMVDNTKGIIMTPTQDWPLIKK